jgi:hypothetical protein
MKNSTPQFHLANLHHKSAALDTSHTAPTYFVSAVHPRHLLGLLWDENAYEGAWMENFRILVRLRGQQHVFEAPGLVPQDPCELAAWVLRSLLLGKSPLAIQDALDRSTAKTWAMIP